MKKLMLVLAAAGAIASIGSAAQAERVDVPGVGYVETDGSYILAEGTSGLPVIDGYVYANSGGHGCADDHGNYGNSSSPTCV